MGKLAVITALALFLFSQAGRGPRQPPSERDLPDCLNACGSMLLPFSAIQLLARPDGVRASWRARASAPAITRSRGRPFLLAPIGGAAGQVKQRPCSSSI